MNSTALGTKTQRNRKLYLSMKHIDDDELVELSVRVIEKLSCMSDEEFSGIDIEFVE